MKSVTAPPIATIDAEHPWLGLVSFTEETRAYFHGREEEVAELGRRVQRKALTVLFGQSGLGKTSILQAGLVPRLRPEGFCPVYVRLDYDPNSPAPADQIKRAVFRATEVAGTWTKSGSAVSGETLWEFFHHRDDVLQDANGRTLTPILIFDQFEEIFTLAQTDEAGRQRAQTFLADLADLVENRPPASLEARIDRDEADAARFDFARADYRILISLREDYLAHLEGLKAQMPSVTQNRMRLARMTGAQAVTAVRAPAPHLVSEAVAEAVVRFVAGGASLSTAEVEPSLLSLICRELNEARLSRGHAEISADLLAGSRDTILSEFYERALADQPAGVRVFIEDELLTDSGFRESVGEERVRKAFAAAGAPTGALAALVDRRLLRVEDRLDLRRVEITHDVLCSVIGASRGLRHEREALEESRRQLAAQQEREAATRRSLRRARTVAAVCGVLMLLAGASAIFGWINLRRARAAEAEAARTRVLAEQARSQAEKLVGFLLEDFAEELRPTGRVEVLAKLADRAVSYYDGLPPEMMTRETKVFRGLALARKAAAQTLSGRMSDGLVSGEAAAKIFRDLRAAGDTSDDTAIGLAFAAYATPTPGVTRYAKGPVEEGVNLLRPIVAAGRASRTTKLTYADLLQYLGHAETDKELGVQRCEEARTLLAAMGALDFTDLTVSSVYGDVTDSQSRMLRELGRVDEAEKLSLQVVDIAEKVLAQRPADLRALQIRYYSANMLGGVALDRNDLAKAETYNGKAVEAARTYTYFNPADAVGWNLLVSSGRDLASTYVEQGRLADGVKLLHETAALERDPRNKTGVDQGFFFTWRLLEAVAVQQKDRAAAEQALAEVKRVTPMIIHDRALNSDLAKITELTVRVFENDLDALEGNYAAVLTRSQELDAELRKLKPTEAVNREIRDDTIRRNQGWLIEASIRTGNFEQAVTAARSAVEQPVQGRLRSTAMDDAIARARVRLAQALLGTGERDQAASVLEQALVYYRKQQAAGASGMGARQDLGRALYFYAKAQPASEPGAAKRRELLAEAESVLLGMSFEAQQTLNGAELIRWVREARAAAGS